MPGETRRSVTYHARSRKEGMSVAEVQRALAVCVGVKRYRTDLRGKLTEITVYLADEVKRPGDDA